MQLRQMTSEETRALMERNDWTQWRAAAEAGVAPQTLRRWLERRGLAADAQNSYRQKHMARCKALACAAEQRRAALPTAWERRVACQRKVEALWQEIKQTLPLLDVLALKKLEDELRLASAGARR